MASSPSCMDVASAAGARTAARQAVASGSAHSPASAIATAATPVCTRPDQAKATACRRHTFRSVPALCQIPALSIDFHDIRKFALLVCYRKINTCLTDLTSVHIRYSETECAAVPASAQGCAYQRCQHLPRQQCGQGASQHRRQPLPLADSDQHQS